MTKLPPDVQAWLELAQPGLDPSEADRVRIGRALAEKLGEGPAEWTALPQTSPTPSAAVGWAASLNVKLIALLSVVSGLALVAGLGLRALSPEPSQPAAPAGPQPSAAAQSAELPAAHPAPPGTHSTSEVEPTALPPSRAAADELRRRDASAARSLAARPKAAAHGRRTRSAATHGTAAAKPTSEVASNPLASQLSQRDAMPRADAQQAGVAATPVPREPEPDRAERRGHLAEELRLIQAATRALDARAGARALELVAQHAAQFSGGILSQEREVLRIAALCQLGRPEADDLRQRFERQHPRSPLRIRIQTHCKP